MSGVANLRAIAVLALAIVVLAVSAGVHADQQHAALQSAAAWRSEMLRQINRIRIRHGVVALCLDDRLNRAAQLHSDDMAQREYFDHRSPEGARMTDRANRTGYRWRRLIENIAAGHVDIAAAVAGWMASPDHRTGILDGGVRDAGIGYAYLPRDGGRLRKSHYWTLLVGRE